MVTTVTRDGIQLKKKGSTSKIRATVRRVAKATVSDMTACSRLARAVRYGPSKEKARAKAKAKAEARQLCDRTTTANEHRPTKADDPDTGKKPRPSGIMAVEAALEAIRGHRNVTDSQAAKAICRLLLEIPEITGLSTTPRLIYLQRSRR